MFTSCQIKEIVREANVVTDFCANVGHVLNIFDKMDLNTASHTRLANLLFSNVI